MRPEADELVGKLESMLDGVERRARAAEERVEEEARLRHDAERRLSEALAEIERLKRER